MDSADKLERAAKANALLGNEFLLECFANLEARYIEAWKAAGTVEAREAAHKYVRQIEWLKDDLRSIATTGNLEERRLAELEARRAPPIQLREFMR